MRRVEKNLRERIKALEQENDEIRADREKYRAHFKRRFKWWIELLGKQTGPNMSWLIEDDSKFLQTVQQFWW